MEAISLSEDVKTTGLNNLAVAHLYQGNLVSDLRLFQAAEEILRRAQENNVVSSVSSGNLCVALIKQGRFEEALEVGRVATRLVVNEQPVNANAFHHMGFALYCLSLPQLAVKYCSMAVFLKPRYAEAYFTRGLARKALGLDSDAISDFEEALKLSRKSSVYSYVHRYAAVVPHPVFRGADCSIQPGLQSSIPPAEHHPIQSHGDQTR